MRSSEFKSAVKLAAWMRCKGLCEKCGARLLTGNRQFDHIIPVEISNDSSLQNCAVLCRACHSRKTRQHDVPTIAKSNRIRKKHIGARTKRGRSFLTNKDGPFKRTMDGRIIKR